ncbi:MAG: DsbA family protein [Candidatus Omnitrophica bacterium]|nr:DsbA family protein [Candidatus Omnitrophota bacterium]
MKNAHKPGASGLYFGAGLFLLGALTTFIVISNSKMPPEKPLITAPAVASLAAGRSAGDPSAPIQIIEYSNFHCKGCAFMQPYVESLLKEHGSKIYYQYRHFSHPRDKKTFLAHMAAQAAAQQGKFFPYKKKLYESQEEWMAVEDPIPLFMKYVEELHLDRTAFLRAVKDKGTQKIILADLEEARKVGIRVTPSFIINGEVAMGGKAFKERISQLLGEPVEKN